MLGPLPARHEAAPGPHRQDFWPCQNPIFFFAQERELAEEALPGDIIGIPNHGTLRVGDTLTEGEDIRFTGIPNFAPEILRRVRLDEPMRAKQLRRALEDLAEEGVTQVFRPMLGSNWIVGVVGSLQLDVLASRIAAEYKIAVGFEGVPYETARWIASDDPADGQDASSSATAASWPRTATTRRCSWRRASGS